MRLWSLHPRYIDGKGLVALWREGLLAQKVLKGATKGYREHPQLIRFQKHPYPLGAIAAYLEQVYREARNRGFEFNRRKIGRKRSARRIPVTRGQLEHELKHLKSKLRRRDRKAYDAISGIGAPRTHPLFRIVPGEVEAWERVVRRK